MRIELKGRNVPVSDDVREYVAKRFAKVGRQVSELAVLEVEIHKERNPANPERHVAEATLRVKGTTLRAREADRDLRHAIHLAAANLAGGADFPVPRQGQGNGEPLLGVSGVGQQEQAGHGHVARLGLHRAARQDHLDGKVGLDAWVEALGNGGAASGSHRCHLLSSQQGATTLRHKGAEASFRPARAVQPDGPSSRFVERSPAGLRSHPRGIAGFSSWHAG